MSLKARDRAGVRRGGGISARAWSLVASSCLFSACGADRLELDEHGVAVEAGPCGRGLLVVESDYRSSNVSALSFDGSVLSPSLISSRTLAGGSRLTLSNDVTLPTSPQVGDRVAILDRDPNSADTVRLLDVRTARVTQEIDVGTGFFSNPYDYLELDEHRAYVARYQTNSNAGKRPYDQGGDILIVDPSAAQVTGRIDLSAALDGVGAGFSPHPAALIRAGDRIFALLAAYADDYSRAATSRLVEIDWARDTLRSILTLSDFFGCDAAAVSPSGKQLAVSCTGDDLEHEVPKLAGSGVVLIDIDDATAEARVERSYRAADVERGVFGFGIDYVSEQVLLVATFGHSAGAGQALLRDSLVRLDLTRNDFSVVMDSLEKPFTFGNVRCAVDCGACFATDAEREGGSVLRFPIRAGAEIGAFAAVRVESRVGLPPRYLTLF